MKRLGYVFDFCHVRSWSTFLRLQNEEIKNVTDPMVNLSDTSLWLWLCCAELDSAEARCKQLRQAFQALHCREGEQSLQETDFFPTLGGDSTREESCFLSLTSGLLEHGELES